MIYECHITCRLEDHREAIQVAHILGWKTSEIARDITLGDATYLYLTKHGRDLLALHTQLECARGFLKDRGVAPIREKIELIVYDTKQQ